jgi:hypothetical protein
MDKILRDNNVWVNYIISWMKWDYRLYFSYDLHFILKYVGILFMQVHMFIDEILSTKSYEWKFICGIIFEFMDDIFHGCSFTKSIWILMDGKTLNELPIYQIKVKVIFHVWNLFQCEITWGFIQFFCSPIH